MPRMQFGISAFERGRGDLPQLPVINFFAESAGTEESGVVLQSRPGLSDRGASMGAGPVEALFEKDGVLSGSLYGVSAGRLYNGTINLGAVDGNGPVSLDGFASLLFVAAGASLWGYDGTTLAAIAFPDSANVIKVVVGASRAIAIRGDTQKFYFSPALTGTIAALDFASAEGQPDRLLDCLFLDDTLVLFGAETVEFWPNTGDPDLPFQPLEGRVFEKGIRATGCATVFDSTFAWVGADNVVYVNGPEAISNPGLEEKIKASTECRLFTFWIDGQEFLALRIDNATYVFGAKNKLWSQFASYGEDNWLPQCHAGGVFGSAIDGRTFAFNAVHTDLDGTFERRFRAGFPLNSGGVTVNSTTLRINVGQTPYLTGDYLEPTLEMRVSRDAGQTWGAWRSTSLGIQGKYRKRVQYRGSGLASQPGHLAEFRITAPVPMRVSDVLINEPFGGR